MGLSTFENHHRLSVWDGEEELVSHSETIFLLIAGLSNESFCDEDNVLCLSYTVATSHTWLWST